MMSIIGAFIHWTQNLQHMNGFWCSRLRASSHPFSTFSLPFLHSSPLLHFLTPSFLPFVPFSSFPFIYPHPFPHPLSLFHLLELLATALTYTEPSLSDTNTCSEAKSECSIACSYYTQTNSLTHATSQTDKEIRAYTKTHTDTEPYTLLNAGANVTLQIFSFPLSCSWSVRRV